MNIVWTKRANADLSSWMDYMSIRNPIAAAEVVELVFNEVETISRMPLIGKAGELYGTREKKVSGTPLRVIYGIEEEVIYILFIAHDRQKWPPNE